MRTIHIAAWTALICTVVLVFAGAIVRASGAGLGCPDWPTCWGCLIPPWDKDQIDVERLDIEEFKNHAARHGIDPATITEETVLDSFNPVHTWTEFINRLISLPLGLASLVLAIVSFRATRYRWGIVLLAWACLADVLFNAWMGAEVVRSGLKPGIITLHLALAFVLICMLTTLVWLTRNRDRPKRVSAQGKVAGVTVLFVVCLFVEGILGSQVREQTDELAKAAGDVPRSEWIAALQETWVYLAHRSFSWSLLVLAVLLLVWAGKDRGPKVIFGAVLAMMAMGVVLGHVAVYPVIQVLHVGLTAVLLAVSWNWLLNVLANRHSETSVSA